MRARGARGLALCLCLLGCGSDPDTSQERERLGSELFELTQGSSAVERAFQGISGPIAANYRAIYAEVAGEISDPAAREAFVADGEARMGDFVQRMFLRINQDLDLRTATREALLPVYIETYSAAELRELLEFYRSNLGRKVIGAEPAQLARALERLMATLLPRIQDLLQSTLEDERRTLRETAGLS